MNPTEGSRRFVKHTNPIIVEVRMSPIWIDAREAARLLSFTPKHFENLRLRGEGPPFYRFGRQVRYRLTDVLEWAESVARPGRAA